MRAARRRGARREPGADRDGRHGHHGPGLSARPDPVYGIHGLAVRSFEPLDGPPSAREPDWTALLGHPVEVDGPASGRPIGELALGELTYWATEADGNWIVRHGRTCETRYDLGDRTITLHPDPRATEGLPLLLLAGSGMAHALTADGHSPLHASAVEWEGRAIAFIGPSGKGKTTLAALLCSAGARSVSDDVLRCEIDDAGATCFRGGSRLRLRPHAASLADELDDASEETADGRTSAFAEPTALERMPLAAVVVPRPSREAGELTIRRLRGREAMGELLRSPRLFGWLEPELQTRHLDLSRDLLERVPLLEATIPWGPPFPPGLPRDLAERVLSPG